MQLIPRYLVSNRSTIVVNETGFVTEYRPVYNRHLNIYKALTMCLNLTVKRRSKTIRCR